MFVSMLIALGCSAAYPITEAATDDGAWIVSVAGDRWPVGLATLPLMVTDAAGAPTLGLGVIVTPGMDGMEHDVGSTVCLDGGDGGYACDVRFLMPGLWNLDGTVSDGEVVAAFRLVVAVE
jgi:hypothetical protein